MPPSAKKDLLLVDDHPIIILAVKSLVESMLPGYRPHSAHTQAEALAMAAKLQPSIAVVDIMLPDGDGIDLIRRLKEIVPRCAVLVFSMQNEMQVGQRALKAGASGYLMKGDKVSAVVEAIRKIETGGIYCSAALTEELMRTLGHPPTTDIESLSDREFHVFRLIGEGRSPKEIARILEISTKTVDSHREKMKGKLDCANATELLLKARDWTRKNQGGTRGS